MSDFKKSKKMDSKKSGETSDLENLIEDIDQAEKEADEQIQTLEIRITEIKELEQKLNSVTEKLSEVEGNALQKAQQDINQNIQQKESEAEDCRTKLNEISEEMQEKQGEINEEISKREGAISELDTTEKECDVDLSDAKEAVNEEKDTFEDANSKIEELLGKINGALADNQAEKKTKVFSELIKKSKSAYATVNSIMSIAGIISSLANPSSIPVDTRFKRQVDTIKSYSQQIDKEKSERRRKELEISAEVRNKPEISSK